MKNFLKRIFECLFKHDCEQDYIFGDVPRLPKLLVKLKMRKYHKHKNNASDNLI